MAGLISLPDELIAHIAAAVIEPGGTHLDRRLQLWSRSSWGTLQWNLSWHQGLLPLLLVSHRISSVCVPLYWKFFVHTRRKAANIRFFHDTIAPRRACHIRHIVIGAAPRYDADDGHLWDLSAEYGRYIDALASVIEASPSLLELSLEGSILGIPEGCTTVDILPLSKADSNLRPLTSLRALIFGNEAEYGSHVDESDAAAIVSCSPELESLSLGTEWEPTRHVTAESNLLYAIGQLRHLVHLEINCEHLRQWSLARDLPEQRWLCPLEVLKMVSCRNDGFVQTLPLVDKVKDTLRELIVSISNLVTIAQVDLPKLQCLNLHMWRIPRNVGEETRAFALTSPSSHPLLAFTKCHALTDICLRPWMANHVLIDAVTQTDVSGQPALWPSLEVFSFESPSLAFSFTDAEVEADRRNNTFSQAFASAFCARGSVHVGVDGRLYNESILVGPAYDAW